jgi:hypothetical protein
MSEKTRAFRPNTHLAPTVLAQVLRDQCGGAQYPMARTLHDGIIEQFRNFLAVLQHFL